MTKDFTLNEERLKNNGTSSYFEELLQKKQLNIDLCTFSCLC